MPNAETATAEEIVDAEFEQAQMEEAALVAITEPLTTESQSLTTSTNAVTMDLSGFSTQY